MLCRASQPPYKAMNPEAVIGYIHALQSHRESIWATPSLKDRYVALVTDYARRVVLDNLGSAVKAMINCAIVEAGMEALAERLTTPSILEQEVMSTSLAYRIIDRKLEPSLTSSSLSSLPKRSIRIDTISELLAYRGQLFSALGYNTKYWLTSNNTLHRPASSRPQPSTFETYVVSTLSPYPSSIKLTSPSLASAFGAR
jgi:hypothetical protein